MKEYLYSDRDLMFHKREKYPNFHTLPAFLVAIRNGPYPEENSDQPCLLRNRNSDGGHGLTSGLVTRVVVLFQPPNGTITFAGTLDVNSYDLEFDSYSINGNYTVSGGTCDGTGTAALRVYNPWDY